ncbi:MAG: virulence RhuM family protein [Spirochaetia bacterium]|nr:virulence RhuM family protein [Spirochaetia bacterium]
MNDVEKNTGEIVIFKTSENNVSIDVRFEGETVWLSQQQMADLYQTSRTNIVEHIKHIYEEEELEADSTCRNFRQVQKEGNRNVSREIPFYNLDMIISLGYRIKSKIATQFRQWATKRLNEYIRKGFTMDDERLKQAGGGDYWKELLARIRDIRSSEKVMYRQVLDLYATSVDYNPKSQESVSFFKMVQNKLHYAVNRQTAAEIIYDRADSEKEFMGLTSFKGADVTLDDVRIAKNYLSEKELKKLNALVSAFFDMAEYQAENHNEMHMSDYVEQLDRTIKSVGEEVLDGAGKISHKKAMEKAEGEYRKYQVKTLSSAEKAYIETLKELKKIESKGKNEK